MLFATDMSALEALSASVTLVFAAAGLGDAVTGMRCGNSVWANLAPCILKTLEPNRVRFMHLYFTLVGMLEFSGFAFASFILHPAVTLISYVPATMIYAFFSIKANSDDVVLIVTCFLVCLACPPTWFYSWNHFGFVISPKTASAVLPHALTWTLLGVYQFVRHAAWVALCFTELPRGIAPWGTLQRPMGFSVMKEAFIEPLLLFLAFSKVMQVLCSFFFQRHRDDISFSYIMFFWISLGMALISSTWDKFDCSILFPHHEGIVWARPTTPSVQRCSWAMRHHCQHWYWWILGSSFPKRLVASHHQVRYCHIVFVFGCFSLYCSSKKTGFLIGKLA